MVNAVIKSRLFNGSYIGGLFHHANQALVSRRAGAVTAWINVCDVAAYRTKMKFFFKVADGRCEILSILSAGSENVKSQTLGALTPNTREFLQLINQSSHWLGEL
jgi:hypothetical protein